MLKLNIKLLIDPPHPKNDHGAFVAIGIGIDTPVFLHLHMVLDRSNYWRLWK